MVLVSRAGIPLTPEETFAWFRKARAHGPAERIEGRLSLKGWVATPRGRVAVRYEFVPDKRGTRVVAHARDRTDGSLRNVLSRELHREVWRMEKEATAFLERRRREREAEKG